jgi:hypothetical protein
VTTAVIVIIVAPLRLIHLIWLLLLFTLGYSPKILILLPFSVLIDVLGLDGLL